MESLCYKELVEHQILSVIGGSQFSHQRGNLDSRSLKVMEMLEERGLYPIGMRWPLRVAGPRVHSVESPPLLVISSH